MASTLWVQFSDCGQHVRKWAREPFDGGEAYLEVAEAVRIAELWRDENKAAAAKARKSLSEGARNMAEMLDGAAIECNAIAGALRQSGAA